jgi:hypothetical protein
VAQHVAEDAVGDVVRRQSELIDAKSTLTLSELFVNVGHEASGGEIGSIGLKSHRPDFRRVV